MLASIHPLGERGRGNRWAVTVGAFAVGSAGAGALAGAILGRVGHMAGAASWSALWMLAAAAAVGALLDWRRVPPPGPKRQVNERWIGAYRGWVYGASFGIQLGAGATTYIVTWLVYVSALSAVLTGSWVAGAAIGLTFGSVRTVPMVAARWIDRPSRLTAFHRRMATLGPSVRTAATVAAAGAAAFAGVGVVL